MAETETYGSGLPGNSTNNTIKEVTIGSEPHWIISVVLSFVVVLVNLYIAVTFIHYVVTKGILKKKKSRRDVNGGLVMILAVAAVVVPFFRYFSTIALLFVSLYPQYENACEIANDFCVAGFGLAVLPTYGFLWARQRAFYGHPSLGHMFGTAVGIVSKISLVLITLSAIISLALGIYPEEYVPRDEGGCVLIGESEEDEYRTYVYAVVMISSQIVLLGLFLHPIRVHAQNQKGLETSHSYSTKSEMSERSSEGLSDTSDPSATITQRNASISTTEEKLPLNTIVNNNEIQNADGHPKQSRSVSLPNNNNSLLRVSKDSDTCRKGSTDLLQIPENGISKARSATVKHESGMSEGTPVQTHRRPQAKSPSLVPNAVARLKKRVRRTTMRTKKVYGLIRRILYLALISILSDLTVMLINAFIVPDDIPQTYAFVMYDCNLLINVVTVVLSFENWRKMMVSPCSKEEKK